MVLRVSRFGRIDPLEPSCEQQLGRPKGLVMFGRRNYHEVLLPNAACGLAGALALEGSAAD